MQDEDLAPCHAFVYIHVYNWKPEQQRYFLSMEFWRLVG